MVKKIWRAIRSMPPPGTRADYYCVCDSAGEAERRFRDKYSFFEGETIAAHIEHKPKPADDKVW